MPSAFKIEGELLNLSTKLSLVAALAALEDVCGSSSVGRASASQDECRGSEPRLPLFYLTFFPRVSSWSW
jgi:hypothetical protein